MFYTPCLLFRQNMCLHIFKALCVFCFLLAKHKTEIINNIKLNAIDNSLHYKHNKLEWTGSFGNKWMNVLPKHSNTLETPDTYTRISWHANSSISIQHVPSKCSGQLHCKVDKHTKKITPVEDNEEVSQSVQ